MIGALPMGLKKYGKRAAGKRFPARSADTLPWLSDILYLMRVERRWTVESYLPHIARVGVNLMFLDYFSRQDLEIKK
jgi:hypothetical protein